MNHCVPDFEVDEDYLLPASSSLKRHKKSAMGDEDIMELLWQNGQVVMQSQNQRSVVGNKKSETMPSAATREIRSGVIEEEPTPCNLFMQEDEMVSWLHYPTDDNSLDLYLHNNEIMYHVLPSSAPDTTASTSLPPPPPVVAAPSSRPPIPPLKRVEEELNQPKFANFLHFSRPSKGNFTGSAPSSSNKISQAAVVESNNRSAAEALQSRASHVTESTAFVSGANVGCRSFGGAAGTSIAGQEPDTCDLSESSSPVTGGSGASASVEPSSRKPPPATDNRKRKGRDTDDTECYSEDAEFEYHDAKKQSRGSNMSTKRSRAAEVHNLSERRRRDRINEKMKALQELIPRCNKSDKASMLDEAIEYLKSLQMQVQMMSMGYNMVPMMFPGVQRYMPTMGMGMGMDQAQVRPMIPCPPMPPNPGAAAGGGPRGFQMPQQVQFPVPVMGPAAARSSQMANINPTNVNPIMNSFPLHNPNQPRFPFPVDPYQQYIGLPKTQLPQPPQNLTCTPSSNKDVREPSRQ